MLLWEEYNKPFQEFRIMNAEFLLFPLAIKAGTEKLKKIWKWDSLINLQCNASLSQNCSEITLQGFYYCLPKESCLCWNFLGQDWQHLCTRAHTHTHTHSVCVCVCVNNYLPYNHNMKSQSYLTDGHLTSVMTVVSIDVSVETEFTLRATLNYEGKARTISPH